MKKILLLSIINSICVLSFCQIDENGIFIREKDFKLNVFKPIVEQNVVIPEVNFNCDSVRSLSEINDPLEANA